VAQREAAMHWIGEELLLAAAIGRDRAPNGNRLEEMAPHDAFRARGEDEWVAIGAADDAAYAALAKIVGIDDARFVTLAGRRAHEDELSGIIAAWTATRDKREIAAALQAAGVNAAPVQCARDLYESPFLRHRGLTQRVTHPAAGTHDYQGLPLHISGWDLSIKHPAPIFGQHNRALLGAMGYDAAAIAGLEATGVIASRPR
jgi:crotonobetainyl-CoA:carnitine CoA-transferase CaiB-like acyl-CoA transferase